MKMMKRRKMKNKEKKGLSKMFRKKSKRRKRLRTKREKKLIKREMKATVMSLGEMKTYSRLNPMHLLLLFSNRVTSTH